MATKERRDELIRLMDQLGGVSEIWVLNLANAKCPMCGNDINEADFRDDISRKEFAISHICQKCQDETFKSEP